MALKIRLRRMGRKKAPHYRIVVAESSTARDGRFVARVGHYNPTTEPATLVVDREKALAWIAKGAQPTDTVQSLLKKAGVFEPAPNVVEQAAEAVTGVAKKAGKSVSGAASAVAGVVASAASAVAGAAASAGAAVSGAASSAAAAVSDRVSGGGDDNQDPSAAAPAASGDDAGTVAVEAEATEPTATATDPGTPDASAAETPVATDAEATEPAADENQG
jgi:small subunit ribosomal protein S16